MSVSDWLIERELHYGGMCDLRRRAALQEASRMDHGYAAVYASELPDGREVRVLVELGILRGTGLALWCDLFPDTRVIGLDVDLSVFRENEFALRKRGAFRLNEPEVYAYDELAPHNDIALGELLGKSPIDVFIDDALHYDEAVMKTMREVLPYMRRGGTYFIEDNQTVADRIRWSYPQLTVLRRGELTIVRC